MAKRSTSYRLSRHPIGLCTATTATVSAARRVAVAAEAVADTAEAVEVAVAEAVEAAVAVALKVDRAEAAGGDSCRRRYTRFPLRAGLRRPAFFSQAAGSAPIVPGQDQP